MENLLLQYIPIYKYKLFNQKVNLSSYNEVEFYRKNTKNLNISFQKKIKKKLNFF